MMNTFIRGVVAAASTSMIAFGGFYFGEPPNHWPWLALVTTGGAMVWGLALTSKAGD